MVTGGIPKRRDVNMVRHILESSRIKQRVSILGLGIAAALLQDYNG